jgi:hypothetical protein
LVRALGWWVKARKVPIKRGLTGNAPEGKAREPKLIPCVPTITHARHREAKPPPRFARDEAHESIPAPSAINPRNLRNLRIILICPQITQIC